jgi:hypothetical protein
MSNFLCSAPGCDKSFIYHQKLNCHLKPHNDSLKQQCPHCSSVLAIPNSLRVHLSKQHTDNAVSGIISAVDFACCFCQERFSDRNCLVIHLNSCHDQNICKEQFSFQSEQELNEFIDSTPDGRFINHKGKIRMANENAGLYFVCLRSKESLRYKESSRNERPVRNVNSTKKNFNFLVFISARITDNGSVDMEVLDYHTCCKDDELDMSKLRLRQAGKKEIEAQIMQELHIDRILENMQASFRSRDERENNLEVNYFLSVFIFFHAIL